LEGEEVAAWLKTNGVTGFVLKYRVPRRAGQPERLPAPGPLLDAQRTVSLVRSRAAEWSIHTNRIGILGFSAGGHLAVATATRVDERGYGPIDEIDKASCRPDFAVGVYPGYFIEQQPAGVEPHKSVLAPSLRIPKTTPPIFLVHASDDPMAGAENSALLYLALKRANVPAELHIGPRASRAGKAACSSPPHRISGISRTPMATARPTSGEKCSPARAQPHLVARSPLHDMAESGDQLPVHRISQPELWRVLRAKRWAGERDLVMPRSELVGAGVVKAAPFVTEIGWPIAVGGRRRPGRVGKSARGCEPNGKAAEINSHHIKFAHNIAGRAFSGIVNRMNLRADGYY